MSDADENNSGPSGEDNGPVKKVPGRDAPKPLPKRFYKDVTVGDAPDGGFNVLLDGRAVRTPARQPLILPTRALADAIAEEWAAQTENINPATMPLSKLAITAIDGVTGTQAEVAADIVRYAGSDLLCYRAEAPEALAVLQGTAWDPILRWVEEETGARFHLAEGVMPVTQSADALERFGTLVAPFDAFGLTALHVMTTLTGSAFIALAVANRRLDADQAWLAAHVDEDWQIARWGIDEEATARRARRHREMMAASRFLQLLTA